MPALAQMYRVRVVFVNVTGYMVYPDKHPCLVAYERDFKRVDARIDISETFFPTLEMAEEARAHFLRRGKDEINPNLQEVVVDTYDVYPTREAPVAPQAEKPRLKRKKVSAVYDPDRSDKENTAKGIFRVARALERQNELAEKVVASQRGV